MADLIDRQSAIDTIDEVTWYHLNKNGEMVIGANSNEHQAWYKADDIYKALKAVKSADEWTIVTEYCRKRNLVIITMESFRVLQAYYNRQNGMGGD